MSPFWIIRASQSRSQVFHSLACTTDVKASDRCWTSDDLTILTFIMTQKIGFEREWPYPTFLFAVRTHFL